MYVNHDNKILRQMCVKSWTFHDFCDKIAPFLRKYDISKILAMIEHDWKMGSAVSGQSENFMGSEFLA